MRYSLSTLVPSPFHWDGRDGHVPLWIILHGTAGPGAVSWFQNPQSQVSAHYVVERDGSIMCCVDENDAAWANGILTQGHDAFWDENINPNLVTISIEHTKLTNDNSDGLTAPQQASSFALVKDICSRWNIPIKAADAQGGIAPHASIDPINRSHCPGSYPWDALWAYLKGDIAVIPSGWKDNGQVLTAPNGVQLTDGFRQWVLTHEWDAANVPLLPAQGIDPVELGNPGLGGGTVQPFLTGVLVWTAKKGVYVMWAGQEYVALRNALKQAQIDVNNALSQVKTLQGQLVTTQNSAPQLNDLKARLTNIHNLSDLSGEFLK